MKLLPRYPRLWVAGARSGGPSDLIGASRSAIDAIEIAAAQQRSGCHAKGCPRHQMGRPREHQARSRPQQTNLALMRSIEEKRRRAPQNFEERRVVVYRTRSSGTSTTRTARRTRGSTPCLLIRGRRYDRSCPRWTRGGALLPLAVGGEPGAPRTSSVAQRGVGHGYETSMNFKRIAHKSHPRLRTSEGVSVAQDVPTKSFCEACTRVLANTPWSHQSKLMMTRRSRRPLLLYLQ